jgi:hypothetical protein
MTAHVDPIYMSIRKKFSQISCVTLTINIYFRSTSLFLIFERTIHCRILPMLYVSIGTDTIQPLLVITTSDNESFT